MARGRKSSQSKYIEWKIAVYIRLSKDDGSDESASVTNQKKILSEYIQTHFDILEYEIVDFYIDDGITGTSVDRESFQRMINDVTENKVNCIICKNLCRMFRDYSEQGYYLEKFFPIKQIRFINIGYPQIDSFIKPESLTGFEVPINGIINDRYAAKLSRDIKMTLDNKRRNGEFIGAYTSYGYKKSPENKNKLIIDEEVAPIVRNIFEWYVYEGYSQRGIAKKLNELGIPSPTVYKASKGYTKYINHMDDSTFIHLWSPNTISKFLINRLYIGDMIQGKQKTISYKIQNTIHVPKNKWIIVENTHEPIISKELFYKAQDIISRNVRVAPKTKTLHMFAGLIRCADCKASMARNKITEKYVYYVCSSYTRRCNTNCTKHTIREDELINMVLESIRQQAKIANQLGKTLDKINSNPKVNTQSNILIKDIKEKESEIKQANNIIDNLYIDWKNGDINREQYLRVKDSQLEKITNLKYEIEKIKKLIKKYQKALDSHNEYVLKYKQYTNIRTLSRKILIELIDTIYVHEDRKVTIDFNFTNEYNLILEYIENNKKFEK